MIIDGKEVDCKDCICNSCAISYDMDSDVYCPKCGCVGMGCDGDNLAFFKRDCDEYEESVW